MLLICAFTVYLHFQTHCTWSHPYDREKLIKCIDLHPLGNSYEINPCPKMPNISPPLCKKYSFFFFFLEWFLLSSHVKMNAFYIPNVCIFHLLVYCLYAMFQTNWTHVYKILRNLMPKIVEHTFTLCTYTDCESFIYLFII